MQCEMNPAAAAAAAIPKLSLREKLKRGKFKRGLFITLMLAYPIAQFLVFWLYVNIDTIALSFQNFSYATGKREWVGLFQFKKLFTEFSTPGSVIPKAVRNSLLYFPFNNFILLPVSIICAYFLFKRMPGAKLFRVVFFLPSIISIVVLTMQFAFMFDSTIGVFDSILKAVGLERFIPQGGWLGDKATAQPMIFIYCLWAGIGYNVVLVTGAISRIPAEVMESGRIDGIGMWRELFVIVVPMIGATISTLFITGSTVIFTIFLQPMLLTSGGPVGETMTIALFVTQAVRNNQLEWGAAVGLFFSIIGIPIIMTIKYLVEKLLPGVEV